MNNSPKLALLLLVVFGVPLAMVGMHFQAIGDASDCDVVWKASIAVTAVVFGVLAYGWWKR